MVRFLELEGFKLLLLGCLHEDHGKKDQEVCIVLQFDDCEEFRPGNDSYMLPTLHDQNIHQFGAGGYVASDENSTVFSVQSFMVD